MKNFLNNNNNENNNDREKSSPGTPGVVEDSSPGNPGALEDSSPGTPGVVEDSSPGTPGVAEDNSQGTPRVCILGLGYIGLPTAAFFAASGCEVVGVDVNTRVVEGINNRRVHLEEPGLQDMVREAVEAGRLVAREAPAPADVFIIAVPTPLAGGCRCDMGCVEAAARAIVPHLRPGNLVILESTVGPGTTRDLLCPLLARGGLKPGKDLQVAFCPERVLPGKILEEMVYNNRIVGGIDENSARSAEKLYRRFVRGDIFLTDATTAETVKLIENTYRDVNIALANELARVSTRLGINVWEAIQLANRHPRVNLHLPGPGVGGHCIAVDPWFIVEKAPEESRLIALARQVNDQVPLHVARQCLGLLEGISSPRVALLGMAYKGNVNDTRESPALQVAHHLREQGVSLGIYDPHLQPGDLEGHGLPLHTFKEAFRGADLLVVLADHREFKFLNPQKILPLVRGRQVLDTRNILEEKAWLEAGFKLTRLGERVVPGSYQAYPSSF